MDSILPNNPQQPASPDQSLTDADFEALAEELQEINAQFAQDTAQTTAALEEGLTALEKAVTQTNIELEKEVEKERQGILGDAEEI